MLQIKDLTIILSEDNRILLENFSLNLNAGDKLALIGEEGNGKSILLKTIARPEEVEEFCAIRGEVSSNNEIIGYLPQTLADEYYETSTLDYLHSMIDTTYFDYNLFYRLLSEISLDESLIASEVLLGTLSGGEKIKFLLLVEMLKQPTLLLLDEPSNDLDLESVQWLERFMQELDIPLIFVSHDNELLSNVANRIVHLELIYRRTQVKHTIASCSYNEYVNNRDILIENETKRANKEQEEFSKKQERFRKVHDSVQNALRGTKDDLEGRNLKDKMHSVKSMERRMSKEESNLTKVPDYEEAIDIKFDEYIIKPVGRVLVKDDSVVSLTGKEFDLIYVLGSNPGKVFSREELMTKVWGYDYYGDVRSIDVHIRRIREKIEKEPKNPKYLLTKWGQGYYFYDYNK